MIDAITSLAFSLCSNKGAYALLLGSGISRSARIPTGWEITLDLVRKLAAAKNASAECDPDPAGWYQQCFNKEPDYSELLDNLGRTAAERQAILRNYFEPSEAEREEGAKVPTAAHRAIAELIALGHIRVVITTNFDRLLEQAMTDIGIAPNVISTPDALEGAVPVIHCKHCIVKLHGDYLDTRISNTVSELSSYDDRVNKFLDRAFDEFGLIVCGWSAEWDIALRQSLERCNSRRYSMYWAAVSKLSDQAAHLVSLRDAVTIQTQGADEFFPLIRDKVQAIEELQTPHPLSSAIAIAEVKKYVVDDKYRIKLHDLVMNETQQAHDRLFGGDFPISGLEFSTQELGQRINRYEAICSVLRDMIINGLFWETGSQNVCWVNGILQIATPPDINPHDRRWQRLQLYPALLLTYAGVIASLSQAEYGFLASIANEKIISYSNSSPFLTQVNVWNIGADQVKESWPRPQQEYTPINNHLEAVIREPFRRLLPQDKRYLEIFDKAEYLLALIICDTRTQQGLNSVGPIGCFGWRRELLNFNREPMIKDLMIEVQKHGSSMPILKSGLFDGSVERLKTAVENVNSQLHSLSW